jgi:hypothetical protein
MEDSLSSIVATCIPILHVFDIRHGDVAATVRTVNILRGLVKGLALGLGFGVDGFL